MSKAKHKHKFALVKARADGGGIQERFNSLNELYKYALKWDGQQGLHSAAFVRGTLYPIQLLWEPNNPDPIYMQGDEPIPHAEDKPEGPESEAVL